MRGTAIGERVVSQANTPDYESGYDRVFGVRSPRKGRWIWDDRTNQLVLAEEYQEPTSDARVPVFGDSHYDGLVMTDGTICDSKRKFREYLKATGGAVASDYHDHWAERKAQRSRELRDTRERRETIGRSVYEVEKGYKPKRRYYDDPL